MIATELFADIKIADRLSLQGGGQPLTGLYHILFWSSGILTGSQTGVRHAEYEAGFWSSGILTGSQTQNTNRALSSMFWSSGILTGSQTNRSTGTNI